VPDQPHREQLDAEILDCVAELIGRVMALGESLAERLRIPAPFLKALHVLGQPMAMKDLGKRMHCDPSFVTVVADMLEKRGLARREAHVGDRRIKNLVLTADGLALKHRIESELAARMPWSRALTEPEREQLLALIRKMLAAEYWSDTAAAQSAAPAAATYAPARAGSPPLPGEVDDPLSAAVGTAASAS
jgi:MarR family transcriptional regulator, organic hydroperoxide resistance regulator